MFNPDRINIHELAIEEPEQQAELPFDPERDITEEDWNKIFEEIDKRRESYNPADKHLSVFSNNAEKIKTIDARREVNITEDEWKKIKGGLDKARSGEHWGDYFPSHALRMKILKPNEDIGLDKTAVDAIKNVLESDRVNERWDRFRTVLAYMKLLDKNMDFNIDPESWKAMRGELEKVRNMSVWREFALRSVDLKILNSDLDLKIGPVEWGGMHKELEANRRGGRWDSFLQMAERMKILTAKKVELTDKGLEITMPTPKFKSDIPPIPETKQF